MQHDSLLDLGVFDLSGGAVSGASSVISREGTGIGVNLGQQTDYSAVQGSYLSPGKPLFLNFDMVEPLAGATGTGLEFILRSAQTQNGTYISTVTYNSLIAWENLLTNDGPREIASILIPPIVSRFAGWIGAQLSFGTATGSSTAGKVRAWIGQEAIGFVQLPGSMPVVS